MNASAIAQELVDLCRQGRFSEVVDRHYSTDVVSVEPMEGPNSPAEQRGLEAIKQKNQWWIDNHDVHELGVDGPFLGDTAFAVRFRFDVTFKPAQQRQKLVEMALYTVADGKIVREEFYYAPPQG